MENTKKVMKILHLRKHQRNKMIKYGRKNTQHQRALATAPRDTQEMKF